MKTIFRYTNIGLLAAAIFASGAVLAYGQGAPDPCADAEGQATLDAKVRAEISLKDIPGRKKAIETSKQFLEKFGACPAGEEFSNWLKERLPKMEVSLASAIEADYKDKLAKRFNLGLETKNWDEVYSAGKEILQKYPDEFRTVVLVLGSIGLDETAKIPRVTKWNDDTLRFSKIAIADLESGKEFKSFGVLQYAYKNKEDALGWMNYTIGYIYFFDKKDKKQGLSHLYKATQFASATKSNPVVYESIGSYYYDEVGKLAKEVDAQIKAQSDTDSPEVAAQKVADIKAKVALVNGTSEAAIDAYARAYDLAKADSKTPKAYNEVLLKTLKDLYSVRFGKLDNFDSFVANTVKKPMPNPLDPVTPISDPDPAASTTTTTTTTTTTSTTPPATTNGKPAATPVIKPGQPATVKSGGVKPNAKVNKAVAKKKAA